MSWFLTILIIGSCFYSHMDRSRGANGVQGRDRNLAARQFSGFLHRAVTTHSDLVVTPDYSMPWDCLVSAISEGRVPEDGKLWALGCESIQYVLARQQNETSWIRYTLEDVYLRAFYLVDQEKVVACGSYLEISGSTRKPAVGVIVASLDGGKSWKIIHEDPQIERFNFLTVDQSGMVWVAGTGGALLRLGPISDVVAPLQKKS